METSIQIFKSQAFGQVRTAMDENGEPLFCLSDVCKALDLKPSKVVQRLQDDVLSKYTIFDNLGRLQRVNFINEDGLYDVIFDSRKEEAKAFRKWVTSEVLPQIRRTGRYELTTAELRQLGERADYCDQVLRSVSCLTTTQVAKEMSMTGTELYRWLIVLGIIYWQSGQYMLYANFAREGLAKSRTRCRYTPTGDIRTETYLVWTEKGRKYLHELFERPESDFARFRDFENASTLLN